jgi:hypothetical protein
MIFDKIISKLLYINILSLFELKFYEEIYQKKRLQISFSVNYNTKRYF